METNDKKPTAVIGDNANVFHQIEVCKRALKEAGLNQQAEEMAKRIYDSNSYGESAKKIMAEYCELK